MSLFTHVDLHETSVGTSVTALKLYIIIV